MELRQLEYFMKLSEDLHFTRAAEQLHISQPTLSHQIKVLEGEMGCLLFDRIGKKISLTEAGHILYEQGLHIFRAIENTKVQINDLDMMQGGALNIGALPGELTNLVSNNLVKYHKQFPQVHVAVLSLDDLFGPLKDNKIDFAISFAREYKQSNDEQLIEIPLYTEELLLVAHREHPLMQLETITLQQVLEQPLVTFPDIQQCRQTLDSAARQEKISLQPIFETSSIEAIFNFVKNHLGVTIISNTLYQLHKSEEISARSINHNKLTRQIVLLYRKDKFMSKRVKAYMPIFILYLKELKIEVPATSMKQLQLL
ncbi:LysR family transcriptional regulator [Bacillus massiliigorillae]|uniref:LysR family transcriptional regulator n=1 Tax=Bacillus massiliigorillae TaxID=1243664 RepID=UPI000399ED93|nr:LysR family transcriptional regulator [Bacillus massiliigorillae]